MTVLTATPEAYDLFHKGSIALAKMEHNGLRVDVDYLTKAIKRVGQEQEQAEQRVRDDSLFKEWRKAFGKKTNVGSDAQLTKLLFTILKVPYPLEHLSEEEGKYTATGKYRASAAVISAVDMPFCKDWIRFKQLRKLRSTFLEGLRGEIANGFVHPVFNLHTVETYRSSSGGSGEEAGGSWNFQNLPVRIKEYAEAIRRCFIPRDGRVLVENDFGALEFRICACVWDDPEMIAYASDPDKDVHRDCAAENFLCPRDEVSKDMRYVAKNQFVFPQLYGSYYVNCARDMWAAIDKLQLRTKKTNTPVKEWLAKKSIHQSGACMHGQQPIPGTFEAHVKKCQEKFMGRFSTFAQKKEDWWNAYQKQGAFRMVTGFVARGVYSKNFLLNAPIQGPGFHCLLKTIIKQQALIEKCKMAALLVGQIHDCAIGDVPESELQDYLTMVKWVVSVYLPKVWPWLRKVPLAIEAEICPLGGSWWEKKVWAEGKDGDWAPVPEEKK